jgi:hypothetical protein
MTHSILWHRGNDVCLFSDSAVSGGPANRGTWSMFGERLVDALGQPLSDNGLKLVRTGNVALTFAGAFDAWHDFLDVYKKSVRHGDQPGEAFATAARSLSPLSDPCRLATAIAWHDGDHASAIAFNADGTGGVKDVAPSSIVQLGSFSRDIKENAEALARVIAGAPQAEPLVQWLILLVTLQLRAMTDRLTAKGIGGALASCRVLSGRIEWQPDIMYVMAQQSQQPVFLGSVLARHDCLVVETTAGRMPELVATRYSDGTQEMLSECRKDGLSKIAKQLELPKRDYLVLCNCPPTSIVVVDIRAGGITRNVELNSVAWKNGEVGFRIAYTDKVHQALFGRPKLEEPPGYRSLIVEYVPPEPLTAEEIQSLIRRRRMTAAAQ